MGIEGIDKIDSMILDQIRDNARLSYSEIGRAVGLSRVAVRLRMERMEKEGIIRGYKTLIGPAASLHGIRFLIEIEAEPARYESIIRALAEEEMIHEVHGASGESRLIVTGIAADSGTLGNMARYLYRTIRGIRKLSWQILVNTYKDVERGISYDPGGQEHAEDEQ